MMLDGMLTEVPDPPKVMLEEDVVVIAVPEIEPLMLIVFEPTTNDPLVSVNIPLIVGVEEVATLTVPEAGAISRLP